MGISLKGFTLLIAFDRGKLSAYSLNVE
jgi:hypothetical protein